jgi:hypothetical protein
MVVLLTLLCVGLSILQPSPAFSTNQIISPRIGLDATATTRGFPQRMTNGDDDRVEGFGVGTKAIELRDSVKSENGIDASAPEESLIDPIKEIEGEILESDELSKKGVPTLQPKAVLRFLAPTLALWIAPPVMSLIDTSVVGRFCGATDLAGKISLSHHLAVSVVSDFVLLSQP